jgi:hypothetical protein
MLEEENKSVSADEFAKPSLVKKTICRKYALVLSPRANLSANHKARKVDPFN